MATTDEAIPVLERRFIWTGVDASKARVEELREAGVSGYALHVASAELAKRAFAADNPGHKTICYMYLAYFGVDGAASFVKVGVSRDPAFRMTGIATGNPLDRLWVFAAKFPSRKDAMRVERQVHAHLSESRRRGEWFRLDSLDEQACRHHALAIKETFIGRDAGLFEVRE